MIEQLSWVWSNPQGIFNSAWDEDDMSFFLYPLSWVLHEIKSVWGFSNLENAVVIRCRFIASRVDFIRMQGLKLYLQLIGSS